jgi:DNA mismatch repair protein MutS2
MDTIRLHRRRRLGAAPTDGGTLLKPSARQSVTDVEAVPDLLNAEPMLAVDAAELCGALDFAFAGGGCLDNIEHAIEHCALAPSDFDPKCFADDLFVDDFVEHCMVVRIKGWHATIDRRFVARVLCHPPSDRSVVDFRRGVLAELADDDALRQRFERLYRSLCTLRSYFDHSEATTRYELTRRRIDTLTELREVVEIASELFCNAESGLSRIEHFAAEMRQSEGYRNLAELLDYENDIAKVDVRMQVGADGRVRRFEIVHLDENDQNRFYASPLGRWLSRIVLWWRGYRFSNAEIVDRWLDHVFQGISHFVPALLQLQAQMEVYLASLAFRENCRHKGLEVCFAELDDSAPRRIDELFNPLLFQQGVVPVPCTLEADDANAITIVTGPNSGGKTRLLQAIGLTQLLAQVGLYVPAAAARLRPASGMFVSVIEEPKADQREGRLGSELLRIRRLFEASRRGALVVLDELCSGTNPSEGEEIFYLVLTLLKELEPEAFITTHFLEFARALASDDDPLDLVFRQVELDEHQRATFRFVPGVATTSLATQTAARLGVTREELMALVKRHKG